MPYGNGVNAAKGFIPKQYLNGTTYSGQVSPYDLIDNYAVSLFTGDPVTFDTNGTIKIGVAGAATIGIFQGCQYIGTDGQTHYSPYWPAYTRTLGGVNATAYIADDPNLLFDVQAVNSAGGGVNSTIRQIDFGNNINFVIAAGNTVTGLSATNIDPNTINTTATLNCKIIRMVPIPGNNPGVYGAPTTYLYNNALVLINNHIYKGGTGTLGI